jgi:hypothetical protein
VNNALFCGSIFLVALGRQSPRDKCVQVEFDSLNLLEEQFNPTNGTLRKCLLSRVCRQKIKEATVGTAEQQHARWCKLIEGRDVLAIDIHVFTDAKTIMIAACAGTQRQADSEAGREGSGCDITIVADGGCGEMTVADIKKQLEENHKIKWTDVEADYVLCTLLHDRRGPMLKDDHARVLLGSSLIVFPSKKLVKLPFVLFEPPAERIEIDGQQQIPVNVEQIPKIDHFLQLQLPQGCTALQLKQQLAAVGFGWAVHSSKVHDPSGNKLIKDECVIPATCDFPLKVIQQMATAQTCI